MTRKKAIEHHPVADLFPMLPDDELKELAASIKESGLDHPIVLDAEGRILDGRNRLAACRLVGVEPRFVDYDRDDADDYAYRNGFNRRHLTTGARAIIAERKRRLNGVTKSGHSKDVEIGRNRLSEAGLVLDWSPDQADAVIAGAKPLSTAVEEARQRKRDAEALQTKMARLSVDAADLRALVDEGRMAVDDAIAALDARQTKRAEEARQREEDRQGAIRRAQTGLRELVNGWIRLTSLPDSDDRDEILAGLDAPDRDKVLEIESTYLKGAR